MAGLATGIRLSCWPTLVGSPMGTGPFCNLVFLANLRHENLGHWQIVAAVSTPMDLLPCPFTRSRAIP